MENGMLTSRQHATYEFIAAFIERHGYAPSYEEIRRHLGLASLNAVAKLVAQLRRRGALAESPHNAKRRPRPGDEAARTRRVAAGHPDAGRAARREAATVPLLGLIAAGHPIEAIENPEPIEVSESMLGPGKTYALRVRGTR